MVEESPRLVVPRSIVEVMIAEALKASPGECCGLLAGEAFRVRSVYPLENEAQSDDEFLVTAGLFEPFRKMRERHEQLLAIYHSHPATAATPSRRDLERNHYPDVVHFIISLAASVEIRAFTLSESAFTEVGWTESG